MNKVQDWLNEKYTDKNTKEIKSKKEGLEGSLEIKDFPELEEIDLSASKGIISLTIINCPKIRKINVRDNLIEEIKGIEDLINLEALNIAQSNIKNSGLSEKNKKLTSFICFDSPLEGNKFSLINGNLRFFNGDGIAHVNSLSTEANDRKELIATAEKLGIKDDLGDKTTEEIKNIIDSKIKDLLKSEGENNTNKENLGKITEKFPDLIKDDKVDEKKLDDIKTQSTKGEELDKLGINDVKEVEKLQKKNEKMKQIIEDNLGPNYVALIEIPQN